MKWASSANIRWHTSPILLIHFRAHWHACCFIALLLLEHLLCVPKVEKARRKRKKSAFFIYIEIWLFFFAGDEIDCRNSESSASLDGHTEENFQWQTTVNERLGAKGWNGDSCWIAKTQNRFKKKKPVRKDNGSLKRITIPQPFTTYTKAFERYLCSFLWIKPFLFL